MSKRLAIAFLLSVSGAVVGTAQAAGGHRSIYDKNYDVPTVVRSGTATVSTVPECTDLAPPAYPADALRSGAQGKVQARLSVGADGKVTDVRVENSSLTGGDQKLFEEEIRKVASQYRCDSRGQPYQIIQEFVFSTQ